MSPTPTPIDDFIDRWSKAEASERANAQQFAIELADLLDVPRPSNDHYDGYSFEFPLKIHRDGVNARRFAVPFGNRSVAWRSPARIDG